MNKENYRGIINLLFIEMNRPIRLRFNAFSRSRYGVYSNGKFFCAAGYFIRFERYEKVNMYAKRVRIFLSNFLFMNSDMIYEFYTYKLLNMHYRKICKTKVVSNA